MADVRGRQRADAACMTAIRTSLLILVAAAGVFGARVGAAPASRRIRWMCPSHPAGGTPGRGRGCPFATLDRAQRAVRSRTAGMRSDIVVGLVVAPTGSQTVAMSASAGDSGRERRPHDLPGRRRRDPAREHVVIAAFVASPAGGGRARRRCLACGRRRPRDPRAVRRRPAARRPTGPRPSRQGHQGATGYAIHSTVRSPGGPEDIELVFNGGKGGCRTRRPLWRRPRPRRREVEPDHVDQPSGAIPRRATTRSLQG